jgi:hypothetical protein
VASGHLVPDGKFALHGHVDLDHLDHTRRQFVAALEARQMALELIPT